jgi:predicted ABC-type sugar transport system permease subunit
LGEGLELDVIAAVIVGGTSLFGGIGSVWGSFVGVFILAFLRNGMVLLGVDAFWQLFATGVVVLLAVLLDQFLSRVSGIRPEV